MNVLKITIVMLVLFLSLGAVCASEDISDDVICDGNLDGLETTQTDVYMADETSFADLDSEIQNATDILEICHDYKFNNETKYVKGINITKSNFVINGNGHKIDANNQARIFDIYGTNITIKNITFINANATTGSAMYLNPMSTVKTSDVIFENNTADNGVVYAYGSFYSSINDKFIDSTSDSSGVVNLESAMLIVENDLMVSSRKLSWGFIQTNDHSPITVLNSIFRDTTSKYCTAIRAGGNTIIRNSKFINLCSTITAGALGLKEIDELIIDNCTFVNVTSDKNGGAIFTDVPGYTHSNIGEVIINRTSFVNCSSGFGGVILHIGGNLSIINSNFTDNWAVFDGGAVYTTNANVTILNSIFDANCALYDEGRGSFGGAIFTDMGVLKLYNSKLTRNAAQYGAAVYLYDSQYYISNNEFGPNVNFNKSPDDIYSVFDGIAAILENNNYTGNGSVSLNNTEYATISAGEGMNLVLINNAINVTVLPSRFDLRDWGWLTSVKNQGHMGSCWTFGSSGAMESAILRFLGIEMDLSENNMQDVSLMYYKYGIKTTFEGNTAEAPGEYALSWLGVFNEEYDVYDELGKISPIFATGDNIHFQDIVMVSPRKNATDNNALKETILKYGGVFINYYAESSGIEQYYNGTPAVNHGVTVVGWDDDRQVAGAPGKGAWIIKNSWGEIAGENGYMYISYYDTAFATIKDSYAYLLENTVPYNKNYQYDIQGSLVFYNASSEYRNAFVALDDDLIAGVGTYFNDVDVEYNVEIYVNDELKLSQSGLSPFRGFHTIKLDSYVPIKEGDGIIVKVKSNCVPVLVLSRQHYIRSASQWLVDGEWINASDMEAVCCLKMYTVKDDSKIIDNKDISLDYSAGKCFSVNVGTSDGHAVSGASVGFTINGKTVDVLTDDEGIAKLEIDEAPGTYVITTVYNNQSYENNVTVTLTSENCKVVAKDIAVDYAGGFYFTVKVVSSDGKVAVKGESVIFIFNGDAIIAKTDKNGIAKIKITQTPGKYTIKTVFNGKTYANKVTVKQVLTSSKVTVKKTAKKFTIKSTLKINGKSVKGKTGTFKFAGKTYKVKTNSNGIAQKTLNKNVIKKLKKGKTYTVKVTYLKDTIKTTVKVK
ncbi:MAG: hypothetical protein IJG09_08800 [Methanobrevibacter sp.]|nr:hypothetical protein [Methanobrevibacter sp.]